MDDKAQLRRAAVRGVYAARRRRRASRRASTSATGDKNPPPADDAFFAGLAQRAAELRAKEAGRLPLFLLDAMLPGQALRVAVPPETDPGHASALQQASLVPGGRIGVVGVDPRTRRSLPVCTAARVRDLVVRESAMEAELVGEEVVRLTGPVFQTEDGVAVVDSFDALDLGREELDTRLLVKSVALEELVERWTSLVRDGGHERVPDHLNLVMDALGPMPDAQRCDARAMWVAALVNPLPALGVALEFRPDVLMATSAEERLDAAHRGVQGSIGHLDGTKRLW